VGVAYVFIYSLFVFTCVPTNVIENKTLCFAACLFCAQTARRQTAVGADCAVRSFRRCCKTRGYCIVALAEGERTFHTDSTVCYTMWHV
jgi:hypothetical protein